MGRDARDALPTSLLFGLRANPCPNFLGCYYVETVGTRLNRVYRCADVEIWPARGTVQVRGSARHVRPKSFEVLEYLIANGHRLVAKDELLDQVWKDIAVNENAPAQCVIELRKAFEDDPRNPRFIKTVSKLGYQFIGPIEGTSEPEVASLELEEVLTTEIETEESSRIGWIIAAACFAGGLVGLFFVWGSVSRSRSRR